MFAIAGIGALIVWYLRKALPELPRWLELKGRTAEAEALMQAHREGIGRGAAAAAGPAGARRFGRVAILFGPVLLPRMILGSIVLIVVNTLIFGFVTWLPTFFVQQGMTLAKSFTYTLIMSLGGADRLRARRLARRPLGPPRRPSSAPRCRPSCSA